MCGIAGVIAWDDRYRTSRETLARMSAAIAHRGPDGEGMWFNHEGEITPDRPQVALAHRRLAVIDLDPRANQPFTDGRGRWIVYNGEIYNYRELRQELQRLRPDYQWRTTSDTEVLLAAYAQWGEDCVQHLNGMFAFAVWDETNRSLFLARDRMGQKPLYMAQLRGERCELPDGKSGYVRKVTAFASELSALIELPWLDRGILPEALVEYLSWGYVPSRWTIFRGAMKLPPGSRQFQGRAWTRGGRYFLASDDFDDSAVRPADSVARTRSLVLLSVCRQMVSDVPIGCFLSGGMDSSVVAACMVAASGSASSVSTFTVGFDDPRFDETSQARAVARHLGTRHHEFRVRPDAAGDLPALAAVYGEPFGDSSALPTHYLSRETRTQVKVALSGDGGDELFGGYDRYRAMRLAERLAVLPSAARTLIASRVADLIPGTHPKSRLARLRRFLSTLGASAGGRYDSIMRLFAPGDVEALLGRPIPPADQLIMDLPGRFDRQIKLGRDPVQAALATDRATYLPDDLLTKLDRASMLHALEVRCPFMDHELVQFAAGLTTEQLLKGGPKRMLREAFAADLPGFVFKRRKMGFAVPIGEWFRGELRPMLHDHLFASGAFARDHFNLAVVRRLVDEHEQQRVDHSQRLYALLMLELWWKAQKR